MKEILNILYNLLLKYVCFEWSCHGDYESQPERYRNFCQKVLLLHSQFVLPKLVKKLLPQLLLHTQTHLHSKYANFKSKSSSYLFQALQ